LEDLDVAISIATKALKLIELYERIQKELYNDENKKFQEEKAALEASLAKLKAYPNQVDVTMNEFSDAKMTSDDETENWIFSKNRLAVRRMRSDMPEEEVEFNCYGHETQWVHQLYGIFIWNGKSVIWTHPRNPFIIRYDWYASKGVFKQYISSEPPKPKQTPPPSLTDWQLTPDGMRAVTVGKRDPAPEVPDITEWSIIGDIPPPGALIVATFRPIRVIIRKLFNMDQFDHSAFVATGLNPIVS